MTHNRPGRRCGSRHERRERVEREHAQRRVLVREHRAQVARAGLHVDLTVHAPLGEAPVGAAALHKQVHRKTVTALAKTKKRRRRQDGWVGVAGTEGSAFASTILQ